MLMSSLYLGLDSSTQGIKASLISSKSLGTIIHHRTVNYDRDLPHYKTTGGMHVDGAQVKSPVLMWLEALDMLLQHLVDDQNQGTSTSGQPYHMSNVVAISGSGQQHGSVYWSNGASENLSSLDPNVSLAIQLGFSFATLECPIWADSSTGAQCAALELAMGGPAKVAAATGSRAYERFTGNQIAKIYQEEKETVYDKCEHISLVSSFMCSLFIGKYAPVDTSDGSGTNLNQLLSEQGTTWCDEALQACGGKTLRDKLGAAMVPAHTYVGNVSNYFVYRYGFSASCEIIAWSGDNPCSLAGLGLQQVGDIAVSMGTSDTMFTMMEKATPGNDGHVLRNPVDPNSFMGMLCFKNGSLAREDMAKELCGGDWVKFGEMLKQTPPGNDGNLGFYYPSSEITPTTGSHGGIQRFGPDGKSLDTSFSNPAHDVRAVLEGKFLAMRHFGEGIGMDTSTARRIIATGGASNNVAILQVLSDVFGCPVYTLKQSDSASLGAAFRALHGHVCHVSNSFIKYEHVIPVDALGYRLACEPKEGTAEVYTQILPRFAQHQKHFASQLLGK
jgi:xylulokinase